MPVVALLWSVISFTVAVGAFCIQGSTDLQNEVLLSVIIGVVSVCGIGIVFFFWHIWKPPRDYEIGEGLEENLTAHGWRERAKAKAREYRAWVSGTMSPRKDENVKEGGDTVPQTESHNPTSVT